MDAGMTRVMDTKRFVSRVNAWAAGYHYIYIYIFRFSYFCIEDFFLSSVEKCTKVNKNKYIILKINSNVVYICVCSWYRQWYLLN